MIRSGDGAALAAVHCCFGFVKLGAGDPGSALWAFEAGLQFSEYLGQDPLLHTRLHLGIGIAHRKLGDTQAAREALAQALEIAHPFRDQHHKASWHLEIADAMVGANRECPEWKSGYHEMLRKNDVECTSSDHGGVADHFGVTCIWGRER
ncbi:MAG TPA: tetratricopeptide repeat protein, partial [bacterium]|nr:tetratricopeptide repeat protein [bacterium]